MVEPTKVLEALNAIRLEFRREAAVSRRAGDDELADLHNDDADDVENAYNQYKAHGDMAALVRALMEFETEPREIALEKLAAVVGKEVLEATGEVKFLR